MKFEWDERKNQSNLAKHGFDFADAFRIFNLPMVIDFDEREDYSEERCVGIDLLDGRVVVVIYSEPDEETVRIISLRKALSRQQPHPQGDGACDSISHFWADHNRRID